MKQASFTSSRVQGGGKRRLGIGVHDLEVVEFLREPGEPPIFLRIAVRLIRMQRLVDLPE